MVILMWWGRFNGLYEPPSAFALLKWRSEELAIPPIIKWHDVFAFTNVVAQSLAKPVGRALRLLLHEMYTTLASLALPVMIGVRDLVCAVSKAQELRSSVRPLEADVDDMFWELDKEDCLTAILHAMELKRLEGRRVWCLLCTKGVTRCLT